MELNKISDKISNYLLIINYKQDFDKKYHYKNALFNNNLKNLLDHIFESKKAIKFQNDYSIDRQVTSSQSLRNYVLNGIFKQKRNYELNRRKIIEKKIFVTMTNTEVVIFGNYRCC